MNICTIGAGYVGLVMSACLAEAGYHVKCVEINPGKVAKIKKGQVPFHEIGLPELLTNNLNNGRLVVTDSLAEALDGSTMVFVAVGTPEGQEGEADLQYIHKALTDLATGVREDTTVVIKSTVPVCSAARFRKLIADNLKHDVKIDIVSNPEFLRQGTAVYDFQNPDRVVIGAESKEAGRPLKELYEAIYPDDVPIIEVSNEAAELIKYVSNTMLALRLSFINELANLCDELGVDIDQVTHAVGYDKRIGHHYMKPGPGFGGSCLPKDVKALAFQSRQLGMDLRMIQSISDVNHFQKELVITRARDLLGNLAGKKVTMLGLSFKPGSDDLRESPALYIAGRLLGEGARITAFDPVAIDNARKVLPQLEYADDCYVACEGADLILFLTDWEEFKNIDLKKLAGLVNTPVIYDTRNLLHGPTVRDQGFTYLGIGRSLLPRKKITAMANDKNRVSEKVDST